MRNLYLAPPRAGFLAAVVAMATVACAQAQLTQPAISLAKPTTAVAEGLPHAIDPALAEDYRQFQTAAVGSSSLPEVFTFIFNTGTTLTGISASNDFHVIGGNCAKGRTYGKGEACTVEVAFTPKGPGHRPLSMSVSPCTQIMPSSSMLAPGYTVASRVSPARTTC